MLHRVKKHLLPLGISFGLFGLFVVATYGILAVLNHSYFGHGLSTTIIWGQVALGVFIYLKTAVDYALFVGSLMEFNAGIPRRIAMNAGTSIGCFVGVTFIAVLWSFFREIRWLMAILLVVAGMILFKLGDGSRQHFEDVHPWLKKPLHVFFDMMRPIVRVFTFFMPNTELSAGALSVGKLFVLSMIIPFALGADDLAGYMVLLSATNIFSLLIGIYLGDAIIDAALFMNQELTVKIVKNRWVSYLGALFFIGLGALSIFHAIHLFF